MINLPKVERLNWLYLDMNSYFATIEQQLDHTLRGKPIAVVANLSDSTSAIAVSDEARLCCINKICKERVVIIW